MQESGGLVLILKNARAPKFVSDIIASKLGLMAGSMFDEHGPTNPSWQHRCLFSGSKQDIVHMPK